MPGQYMNAARNCIYLALLIVVFAASVAPAPAQDKRAFAVIPANKDHDLKFYAGSGAVAMGPAALARAQADADLILWLAGNQFFDLRRFWGENAKSLDLENAAVRPESNLLPLAKAAFEDTRQHNHSAIRIKPGVKEKRLQMPIGRPFGRRNTLDDGLQNIRHALPGFCADQQGICGVEADRAFKRVLEDRTLGRGEPGPLEKTYLAITHGLPPEGDITLPLELDAENTLRVKMRIAAPGTGLEARTGVSIVDSCEGYTLIRCALHTGRQHQIRAHLSALGCPVVGDKLYGPDEGCYLEFIDTGWTPALAARLLLPRHALHSTVLHLPGRGLHWESLLAPDLAGWIRENLLAAPEASAL